MVPNNHKDRQLLSLRNKSPISQKPMKETYKNWGIPLTVITKETVQAKDRDNKIKKERGPTNSQQK